MRLDHIAYRVKDRDKTAQFFMDAFGYKRQTDFEIALEDGSAALCVALKPPEKWREEIPFQLGVFHLAPEIFVSSGPPGSLIDKWVENCGHGIGGIHHLAYQVDDVAAAMKEWKEKGWFFTTEQPLQCEDLTQVFSMPHPLTGVIFEFIERRGQHGFCKDNVAKLMGSTSDLKPK